MVPAIAPQLLLATSCSTAGPTLHVVVEGKTLSPQCTPVSVCLMTPSTALVSTVQDVSPVCTLSVIMEVDLSSTNSSSAGMPRGYGIEAQRAKDVPSGGLPRIFIAD